MQNYHVVKKVGVILNTDTRNKLLVVSSLVCVVLLVIATFFDLQISNAVINYNSIFGTVFQTVGESPIHIVFFLSGQIGIAYACRHLRDKVFAVFLFVGSVSLSVWQMKQFLNVVLSYTFSAINNVQKHRPIGLANSDGMAGTGSLAMSFLICLVVYLILTAILQYYWLHKQSDQQLARYLLVAVFASLTVWFAEEVNATLKNNWGRFRPYELNASQTNFTSWLHPNGINGHKSFPSGHTMAGISCVIFSWFATKQRTREILWVFGVVWGILVGISRIVIGAHFLSDVTFSFFLTAAIIYIIRALYQELVSDSLKL
ncbi:phosphatase PAP2 family protein [Lactiplantibacillus plantarum]|uniref:phosphatase PAP2 family protein n=1 Tax=Lactiplantibacillus plantarum TaxID=1590 RepID=UPI0018AD49CA|nr:phosphatase PAP2 family protein [Lactiplantibacillus plantarum]WGF84614.1 phosphatase PAP2 family protein [Lactiplantibacillus plantarum]WGG41939.1 phosphatase PAP2 family protein [Lactiplantibacillus plantarum]